MDWEVVIWMLLGIVGAALIAGGIVAYRGSAKTGVRAAAASAVSAGLVMWAIVAVTIPVSGTDSGSPPAVVTGIETLSAMTEESFKALLTEHDVRSVLETDIALTTRLQDYRAMASSIDPSQVADMDSFYGLVFEAEDSDIGMTFSVMDFDSESFASDHIQKVKTETPGMQTIFPPVGDTSAFVEVNAQGIGSILVFAEGDKVVSLHTAQPEGQSPLTPLDGLIKLARLVASRL